MVVFNSTLTYTNIILFILNLKKKNGLPVQTGKIIILLSYRSVGSGFLK